MYVELHARSAFSFLRGGSSPDDLVAVAAQLQLPSVALCDRNGVYGAVRFHLAAKAKGVRALVGCELTMEDESVVPVLVMSQIGYRRLCTLLTTAGLRAPKGEGRISWAELEESNAELIALTGDEEGPVRRAWKEKGIAAGAVEAQRLKRIFGDRLYVEVQRHLLPGEADHNEFLITWARASGVPLLATNGVRYATQEDGHVYDVFSCLRHHVTLDTAGKLLTPNRQACLKSARQMETLFGDLPEALANTARAAKRLDFTLDQLGYRFPDFPTPPDQDQNDYLRKVTYFGAHQRYGSTAGPVGKQLDRELQLITKLGFAGYFLMVWDLCAFARSRQILVQGRGSAANSAVCYSLGITAVDPIASKLLFERFLSEGRSDWPDIDLDLPSGEPREEVIQEVYRRYGRTGSAMTANVIRFQGKSTMREVGKVFGFSDDVLDRFSALFAHGDLPETLELKDQLRAAGVTGDNPRSAILLETVKRIYGLPRHLGQHSGGMVVSYGHLSDFVPLENASMPGRSVIQWDKTDCEEMGIVKVDLLGLGMMKVLQDCIEICANRGQPVDLAAMPKDDRATFKIMQEADTVGVFQIESRAQMATLPRMKPAVFYDVAITVALIRPGPIQGEATNPYLNRRQGKEPVTYLDDRLKPILERTLGIVLFQEQILRIAMELANFTAGEADELRRAIGFSRSPERLRAMEAKLHDGLRRNGVTEVASDAIRKSLSSFALYGFPESHAISFGMLAYASAWMKVHRPAAFLAALLNCQPMGFYSEATLVQDARRHGLKVLPVCVRESEDKCRVVDDTTVRLGFSTVKGFRATAISKLLAARNQKGFSSVREVMWRIPLTVAEGRLLALTGALNRLAEHRRAALWQVESVDNSDELFRFESLANEGLSPLERMTHLERLQADYATIGLTVGPHPMALIRAQLPHVTTAAGLSAVRPGTTVTVAGSVITRQRPGTAKGFCFVTLEDETGHANTIVRPTLFEALRQTINIEPSMTITGRLQNDGGVIHVMADEIQPLLGRGLPS